MNFNSRKELEYYLKRLISIGSGSQGECFYRKKENDVLKIFHDFTDELDGEYREIIEKQKILRFSNIKNKTFIWPNDVITVNDEIVGYITPYIKAKNLYKNNPLTVNLDNFEKALHEAHKDIKIISNNNVQIYDVTYNTLFNNKFYIIDQDEYSYSNLDNKSLEQRNKEIFNYEIYYFLVDNLFERIINDNKELKDVYKNKKEDILIFMKLLRKRLSELAGKKITTLMEANKYRDKYDMEKAKYIRM